MSQRRPLYLLGILLCGGISIWAAAENEQLPVFRVQGTPWQYARIGEIEVLTRASEQRSRTMVAALLRGQRIIPDFFMQGAKLPFRIILVDERERVIAGLTKLEQLGSDEHLWGNSYSKARGDAYEAADTDGQLLALNLADIQSLWPILMGRAQRLVTAQSPAFPEWVLQGLFGPCGPLQHVIGLPRTATVQLPKHSWPDQAVPPGIFPAEATYFPSFSVMFDPSRKPTTLTPEIRKQFEFQTGLLARWSLFGPVKTRRNRNGYWALAEMARRGSVTEALFQECIGMSYAMACAEMKAYVKTPAVGILNVRMPEVMADVPEAENLTFRVATPAEVTLILTEFKRLFPHASTQLQSKLEYSFVTSVHFPDNSAGNKPKTRRQYE